LPIAWPVPLAHQPVLICPTVALYDRAYTIEGGRLTGEWEITARDRRLTV